MLVNTVPGKHLQMRECPRLAAQGGILAQRTCSGSTPKGLDAWLAFLPHCYLGEVGGTILFCTAQLEAEALDLVASSGGRYSDHGTSALLGMPKALTRAMGQSSGGGRVLFPMSELLRALSC